MSSNSRFFPYLALLFIWFAHFFVDMMLGIWPVYKSLVHLDLAKAGIIVALGALMGEGSQIIFGSLSDGGYHQTLIILGVLATATSAFLAYFTTYGFLFAIYLLTCIGSGAFHPAAAGLMNTMIPSRRGLLMTFFTSGGNIGLASSQLIFTYVYGRGHSFILAIPALCLAIIFLVYTLPRHNISSYASHSAKFKSFISFFKNKFLRYLYFSQVANQTLLWGTIFILPDVLKTLGHVDWVCYGGGHFCFILGSAVMMVPAGYLADRYSAQKVMFVASLISFILFYFILFSGGISVTISLIALFILGSSLGIINPLGVALGNRYVPDQPGAISAFLMGLVWCVSEVLGPGGVGLMTMWFGDYGSVKALAVLGTFFLLQLFSIIRLLQQEKLETIERVA